MRTRTPSSRASRPKRPSTCVRFSTIRPRTSAPFDPAPTSRTRPSRPNNRRPRASRGVRVRWTFRRRARCRRARASPPATRWRMTTGADRNSRNSRSQPLSPRCDGGRCLSTAASASRCAAAARPIVAASASAIVGRHAEKATVTKSR